MAREIYIGDLVYYHPIPDRPIRTGPHRVRELGTLSGGRRVAWIGTQVGYVGLKNLELYDARVHSR